VAAKRIVRVAQQPNLPTNRRKSRARRRTGAAGRLFFGDFLWPNKESHLLPGSPGIQTVIACGLILSSLLCSLFKALI
jgi:hypothetical protein